MYSSALKINIIKGIYLFWKNTNDKTENLRNS